jgi:AcrR family transcriptional regulator
VPHEDHGPGVSDDGTAGRRKLPKQQANESRMITAAIDLLADHAVDEVTNVAVAAASATQPSYVTRYFGSRDLFLLAVADELTRRIAGRGLGMGLLYPAPARQTSIAELLVEPEVAAWFKLWRYLVGRDLPPRGPEYERGRLLTAGAANLGRELGLPPEQARSWSTISLLTFVGYRLLSDILGISPEEAGILGDTVARGILRDAEASAAAAPGHPAADG